VPEALLCEAAAEDLPAGAPPVGEGPLPAALTQLRDAAAFLAIDDGLRQMLATPRREVTVSIPLRRDDGQTVLVTGHRVQHSLTRGPAKGGLRFSPHVDLDAVRALAMWMTWKCASSTFPTAAPWAVSGSIRSSSPPRSWSG